MDRSTPNLTFKDKIGMEAYTKTYKARSHQPNPKTRNRAARRAQKAAVREVNERMQMGREDMGSHAMRYDAAVGKQERAKMGAEDSRSQRVAAAAKKKVVKSNVVSIKPKTDKKRKAFDPKLLFKRKR